MKATIKARVEYAELQMIRLTLTGRRLEYTLHASHPACRHRAEGGSVSQHDVGRLPEASRR